MAKMEEKNNNNNQVRENTGRIQTLYLGQKETITTVSL